MDFPSECLVFFLLLLNSRLILSEEIKSEISCSSFQFEHKLEARGQILKLSEILNVSCSGKIKFIEIFALDKILIDENLIKVGEEIQVNIIAPVWEIEGEKTINLDGADAVNSWKPERQQCDYSGESVADGLPGLPGGPGGIFFGIMSTSINGKNLKISSNGGNGSNGQDACNGIATKNKTLIPGNGGRRGSGGYHGLIKLFSLKNDFTSVAKNGSDGKIGKKGETLFQVCINGHLDWMFPKAIKIFSKQTKKTQEEFKIMAGHENLHYYGREDFNTEGYKYPKKAIVLEDFSEAVKRYRKYFLQTMFKSNTI